MCLVPVHITDHITPAERHIPILNSRLYPSIVSFIFIKPSRGHKRDIMCKISCFLSTEPPANTEYKSKLEPIELKGIISYGLLSFFVSYYEFSHSTILLEYHPHFQAFHRFRYQSQAFFLKYSSEFLLITYWFPLCRWDCHTRLC